MSKDIEAFMIETEKMFADFTADLSMHAANISLDKEERRAAMAKLSVLAFTRDRLNEIAKKFKGHDERQSR